MEQRFEVAEQIHALGERVADQSDSFVRHELQGQRSWVEGHLRLGRGCGLSRSSAFGCSVLPAFFQQHDDASLPLESSLTSNSDKPNRRATNKRSLLWNRNMDVVVASPIKEGLKTAMRRREADTLYCETEIRSDISMIRCGLVIVSHKPQRTG